MLSFPSIVDLIKPKHRKADAGAGLAFLVDPKGNTGLDTEAYLVHLAASLDLEVLALGNVQPGAKSAELGVAGRSGHTCTLTVPDLDNGGLLAHLIAEGEPASRTARIFGREEVFPCEGAWCDLIPMDTTVAFLFMPLAGLPVARALGEAVPKSLDGDFVLVVAGDGETGDREFVNRALTAASLLGLSKTLTALRDDGEVLEALRGLLLDEGYTLSLQEAYADMKETTVDPSRRVYPVGPDSERCLVVTRENGGLPPEEARKRSLKMLNRLMSVIAHEIKNPLTGIAAGVQYISKKLQSDGTEDDTVEFVLAEIARLNRIVDDLYHIAKPPDLVIGQVRVNEIVSTSLLCLSEQIMLRHIDLKQKMDSDLPDIQADGDRLQQVFINVAKNAIEVTPNGGSIEITTRSDGPEVVVSIKDGGRGISPEERRRIFEPFYSTKEGGTGLGLCISQRIVEQHGGAIEIEIPPTGGTVFVIRLPITAEPERN